MYRTYRTVTTPQRVTLSNDLHTGTTDRIDGTKIGTSFMYITQSAKSGYIPSNSELKSLIFGTRKVIDRKDDRCDGHDKPNHVSWPWRLRRAVNPDAVKCVTKKFGAELMAETRVHSVN